MAAAKAGGRVAQAESSKQPTRKRVRTTQDASGGPRKRTKLSLTRLLDLPPEVFNEVAIHLLPTDLLSLARSNKFFRRMFMSRASQSLWKSAIHNVPGLPQCPPQMSEPQYISLIYSKQCSSCGTRALRPMDPYLLVRLCNKCRDSQLQLISPYDVVYPLVPASHLVLHISLLFTLKEEYVTVFNTPDLHDHESSWYQTRSRLIRERKLLGAALKSFLDTMESEREAEVAELKNQRFEQIRDRVIESGWTDQDMIPSPANSGEWDKLVFQTKPVTDRIWTNLYPKLLPLLTANREYHERREREKRRTRRVNKIQDLTMAMQNALPPLVRVTMNRTVEGSSSEPLPAVLTANYPDTKVDYPFPSSAELLGWPMIKNIVEEDSSPEDAEAKFAAIRDDVDRAIVEWRNKVEQGLVDIWNAQQDTRDDEKNLHASKGKGKGKAATRTTKRSARKAKGNAEDLTSDSKPHAAELVLPEFTVTFSKLDGTTTTDLSDLSPNLQLLLRADTIFKGDHVYHAYPAIVPYFIFASNIPSASDESNEEEDWSSIKLARDDECSTIAKQILARIGRPNATSAEMEALGANFRCGRCASTLNENWDHLIHHFAKEESQWTDAHEMMELEPLIRCVYNRTHGLELGNAKPFAHFMTPQQSAEYQLEVTMQDMPMMQCIKCEDVGIDAVYPHVYEGTTQSAILEHLRDVHHIPTAIPLIHFRRWAFDLDFFDPWDDEDEEDDLEFAFWDMLD
ncbi:hypothetical protein RhiLY_00066 [Ceratobasidium sp. AG-Ba]|nr:hypothetical protein RhiLY_00066 [Ceratobasidium sp. AG-Ba]